MTVWPQAGGHSASVYLLSDWDIALSCSIHTHCVCVCVFLFHSLWHSSFQCGHRNRSVLRWPRSPPRWRRGPRCVVGRTPLCRDRQNDQLSEFNKIQFVTAWCLDHHWNFYCNILRPHNTSCKDKTLWFLIICMVCFPALNDRMIVWDYRWLLGQNYSNTRCVSCTHSNKQLPDQVLALDKVPIPFAELLERRTDDATALHHTVSAHPDVSQVSSDDTVIHDDSLEHTTHNTHFKL